MTSNTVRGIFIDPKSIADADNLLKAIGEHARGAAITRVLKAAGQQLVDELKSVLPKPGYPGDKPSLKPLRDTVAMKVKNYQSGFFKVLIVGYAWPAGNHGNLVEFGHDIAPNTYWNGSRFVTLKSTAETGKRVEGKFYFATSVRMAQPKIDNIILSAATREAAKVRPTSAAA
jgi:Bacteriophage HK97-gp10, putative tail-component